MTEPEYIASKLGGYDWRGKTDQVAQLLDEFYAPKPTPTQAEREAGTVLGSTKQVTNPTTGMWQGYNASEQGWVPDYTNQYATFGAGTEPINIGDLTPEQKSIYETGMTKSLAANPGLFGGMSGSSHKVAGADVLNQMWR
jgi:hypothetical protein